MANHSSEAYDSRLGARGSARFWFSACSAVSALIVAATVAAQTPDRAKTEALARRATERLQALQREADELAAQERTLLGDLRKLELERRIKAEQLHAADAAATQAAADLESATAKLKRLEAEDLSQRPELRARVVELYKMGQGRYLRLLLSTADVRRIADASRMAATLAALDRRRIESHRRTVAEMRATQRELEQHSRHLTAARGDAQRAAAAAARAAESRDALIRDIDRRRDLNAQFAGELQAAQARLQLSLREMTGGAPATEPASLPLRPFRGDLPWPADGAVRRRTTRPAAGTAAASKGIDIAAADGAAAKAVHEGVVAYAGPFTGFGNLVIVDHGAQAFSLYGNLAEIAVTRGARVGRGDTVGMVGESATGQAGLYFELRIDGQPVDPLQWLKKR